MNPLDCLRDRAESEGFKKSYIAGFLSWS